MFCVFLSLNKFAEVSDTLWAQCQVPSLSKSCRVFFEAGRHPSVNLERLLCKAGRNHSSTRSYRFYTNFVPLLHPKIQDYTANYTL